MRVGDAEWRHTDTPQRVQAFYRAVLLVKGTGSDHLSHRTVETLAAVLPHAAVAEFAGGHAAHIVDIDGFLARLSLFLADAERSRSEGRAGGGPATG